MTDIKKTKLKILTAAVSLFRERPVDEVRITDICEKAGVSPTAFYYNFKNKENLLCEVVLFGQDERISSTYVNKLFSCDNYWEQIVLIHTMLTDSSVRYGPEVIRTFYISELKNKNLWSHSSQFLTISKVLSNVIKKAQAEGEIRNMSDPSDLAFCAMQTVEALSAKWSVYPDEISDIYDYFRKKLEVIYDVRVDLRSK